MSRLDRVIVSYSRGQVELPWESRDAMLAEISHLEDARGVVAAFDAVGASRPVEIADADVAFLVEQLDRWGDRVKIPELPAGVWDLRCALHDDLHDASAGE